MASMGGNVSTKTRDQEVSIVPYDLSHQNPSSFRVKLRLNVENDQ